MRVNRLLARTDAAPEPGKLAVLIKNWRETAARQRQEARGSPDSSQIARLEPAAEVFEHCAAELEEAVAVREADPAGARPEPGRPIPPITMARRLAGARPKPGERNARMIDAILVLAFLMVVAGCAYLIIKIITRWRIKGLG